MQNIRTWICQQKILNQLLTIINLLHILVTTREVANRKLCFVTTFTSKNVLNFNCVKTHHIVVGVMVVLSSPWPYLDLALTMP